MKLKQIICSTLVLTTITLFASDLPKVENKTDAALDYSKHELQLFLKGVDKSKIPIGSISKDGTIQIALPDIDIKAMYKNTDTKPPSVETIFRMASCKGRNWDAPSKYTDVYPYMYNSISVELYGLHVGILVPASSEKVLRNNLYRESTYDYRYHNETSLSLGSEYYFYHFDKDLIFKERCVSANNDKWADVSDIEAKRGWHFVEESLLSIDKDSKGKLLRLGVSYKNAEINNTDIKWYLKALSSPIPEKVIVLAKKMYQLIPLSKSQFMSWVPSTLGDFKLTSKEHGKFPDKEMRNSSPNNVHLIYKYKEKKIDMYVVDTAKFVEDLGNAKMAYEMEASFGKKKTKTPYISQKRDGETMLLYIHKDRILISASGFNMEADEMWEQIERMGLGKLLPKQTKKEKK